MKNVAHRSRALLANHNAHVCYRPVKKSTAPPSRSRLKPFENCERCFSGVRRHQSTASASTSEIEPVVHEPSQQQTRETTGLLHRRFVVKSTPEDTELGKESVYQRDGFGRFFAAQYASPPTSIDKSKDIIRPLVGRLPTLLQASRPTEKVANEEAITQELDLVERKDGGRGLETPQFRGWQSYSVLKDGFDSLEETGLSTTEIYERLHIIASKGGNNLKVWALCRYLIQERNQQPNAAMYSALILSNVDPQFGSGRMVHSMLEEMQKMNIELSATVCHDILKALSVHPDYILLSEVLSYMQERWLETRSEGHHAVAATLLRSGQYEMAVDKLEHIRGEGITVQPWLYDMVIYHLSQHGEHDEILKMIEQRTADGDDSTSAIMWNLLLENAAQGRRHDLCHYIWSRRVSSGYLNPNNGVCVQVLATAAQRGDAVLATEVFNYLGERGTIFQYDHYELLVEAYARAGDLNGSFSMLCVMQETGLKPNEASTRAICESLSQDEALRNGSYNILRRLKEHERRDVPLIAINAIIEANALAKQLEAAIEVYKALKTVVPSGPNVKSFNLLFTCCVQDENDRKDLALALAAEMAVMRISPNNDTYHQLIEICRLSDEEGLKDAFHYAVEAQSQGVSLPWEQLHKLCQQLAQSGLQEAWTLCEGLMDGGYLPAQIDRTRATVLECFNQPKQRSIDTRKPPKTRTWTENVQKDFKEFKKASNPTLPSRAEDSKMSSAIDAEDTISSAVSMAPSITSFPQTTPQSPAHDVVSLKDESAEDRDIQHSQGLGVPEEKITPSWEQAMPVAELLPNIIEDNMSQAAALTYQDTRISGTFEEDEKITKDPTRDTSAPEWITAVDGFEQSLAQSKNSIEIQPNPSKRAKSIRTSSKETRRIQHTLPIFAIHEHYNRLLKAERKRTESDFSVINRANIQQHLEDIHWIYNAWKGKANSIKQAVNRYSVRLGATPLTTRGLEDLLKERLAIGELTIFKACFVISRLGNKHVDRVGRKQLDTKERQVSAWPIWYLVNTRQLYGVRVDIVEARVRRLLDHAKLVIDGYKQSL